MMEAFNIARNAFVNIYATEPYARVKLEEVEETEDGKNWLITLGYDDPESLLPQQRAMLGMFTNRVPRLYKSFTIDKATGAMRAMKVRTVN